MLSCTYVINGVSLGLVLVASCLTMFWSHVPVIFPHTDNAPAKTMSRTAGFNSSLVWRTACKNTWSMLPARNGMHKTYIFQLMIKA